MYQAAADRYDTMEYKRCGRSGLKLPRIALGLWQNFGLEKTIAEQEEILCHAFDHGITHFDLANNYGHPSNGLAEKNFGQALKDCLGTYRDELVISTKAGYDMWPGPYGNWGSRKYLMASLDQSLKRMGVEYVDIFYSHRVDENTPMEETAAALAHAVQSGKALYVGISSYSTERTTAMAELLREWKIPLLIHQPSYNLLNRWVDKTGLLDALEKNGTGCIAFTPLAQGLLTDRYLHGIPADSRVRTDGRFLKESALTEEKLAQIRALNEIAAARGQTLAEMALAWILKDGQVTSVLIGASKTTQILDNLKVLESADFTEEERKKIDELSLPHEK